MLVTGGLEPFWDGNDTRAIRNTLKKEVNFNHREFRGVSSESKDFIRRLLEKGPDQRLTGAQCVRHPWLAREQGEMPDLASPDLRLQTHRIRKFMARYRWKKAIRAVRTMVRVTKHFDKPEEKSQFNFPEESRFN